MWLNKLLQKIPKTANSIEVVKYKIVINICALGLILILIYGLPLSLINGNITHTIFLSIYSITTFVVLMLIIKKGWLKLPSFLLITISGICIAAQLFTLQDSLFSFGIWFLLIILLSIFFFEKIGGIISIVFVSVVMYTKAYLDETGYLPNDKLPKMFTNVDYDTVLQLLILFTSVGFIVFFIFSQLKKSHEKMAIAIKDKEVLLKEVHHRVKNNLQVIISLLSLQSNIEDDEKFKDTFNKCQNRINSMSIIHELLYQSDNVSSINLKEYIQELAYSIAPSIEKANQKINLNLAIESLTINIDTAIPLGLLINEIITNSFKHGFPNINGEIQIKLMKQNNHTFVLEIGDNGVGKGDGANNKKTLGLNLIKNLTKQIDGTLSIDKSKKGMNYIIHFNEIKNLNK